MNKSFLRTFFPLFLLILLFYAYRLLTWGITPCDELMYRGLLAKDIIDGLKAPLYEYRITPYSNDTHWLGFVSVPFFLLFGDSFLILYLMTTLLPCLTLVGLYLFASKYFSYPVAVISCYVYVLTPFMYVHDSVYGSGAHPDISFFMLFALYCFYGVFFSPLKSKIYYGLENYKNKKRKIMWIFIIWGVVSGIACYLCLGSLASLVIFLFFWILFDPQLLKKRYSYIFFISFVVSFLPRIIDAFYFKEESLNISTYTIDRALPLWNMFFTKGSLIFTTVTFLKSSIKQFFSIANVANSVNFFIPDNLFYYLVISSMLAACLTTAHLLIKNIISAIKKVKKQYVADVNPRYKEIIIFSYVLLIGILWLVHPDIWPDDIYLSPAYPFLAMLIGILIDKLWKIKLGFIKFRMIAVVLLMVVLASGFVYFSDATKTYAVEDIRKALQIKGYSLELDPMFSADTHGDFLREDLFNYAKFVRNYNDEHMDTLYNTIRGIGLRQYSFDQKFSLLEQMNPSLRALVCINLGLVMGDGLGKDKMATVAFQLRRVLNQKYHHYFYEGIALSYCNRMYTEVVTAFRTNNIKKYIPAHYRHYFYLEFGRRIAEKHKKNLKEGIAFLRTFSPVYHGFLYQGFISALTEDEMSALFNSEDIENKDFLRKYIYYHKGELIGDVIIFPSDNGTDTDCIADSLVHIPPEYGVYYMWGLINQAYTRHFSDYGRDFSGIVEKDEKGYDVVPLYTLKEIVETVSYYAINQQSIPFVYQGLGLSISLKTFGEFSYFNSVDTLNINDIIPQQYCDSFYEGIGLGLALRYSNDKERIADINEMHIPSSQRDMVLDGWRMGLEYLLVDPITNRKE